MYILIWGACVFFASAFIGAVSDFLWFMAFPAQFSLVNSSLMLGGVIAVWLLTARKELLSLPLDVLESLQETTSGVDSG